MTAPATPPSSTTAAAAEAFLGIRVELPTGKTFVCRKPVLFVDGLRWIELFEAWQKGVEYSKSLGIIVKELPAVADPVDMSVLEGLTVAEFVDWVVCSFFSHRRFVPGWIQALIAQQASGALPAAPTPSRT